MSVDMFTPPISRKDMFDGCTVWGIKTESSRFNGLPDVIAVLCVNLQTFSSQHISFSKCFHLYVACKLLRKHFNNKYVSTPAACPSIKASALVCVS
jgi:hypothetical protein